MKLSFLLVLLSAFTANTATADCVDVIRASLTVSTVVSANDEIIESARNFCQSYSQSKSEGNSFTGGVSYGVLSGSAGGTRLTVDEVAQKYCDARDNSQARSSAYQQYIESIAPGAYSSYDNCVNSSTKLKASLNPNAILQNSLVIVVHNENNSPESKDSFQANPSPNIECVWAPSDRATVSNDVVSLPGRSSASLRCTREKPSERAYVTLATTTAPDEAYTFSWTAFQDGLPVDQMQTLRDEVAATKQLTNAFILSNVGSVVAFRSSVCPSGWIEAADVSGRVIVGSGSGNGLTPRANGEVGGTETHTLTVPELPSHSHGINLSVRNYSAGNNYGAGVVRATDKRVEIEANGSNQPHNNMPPYIVLKYCERIKD